MKPRRDLPVAVVGGGPAGSVCARQLARAGRAVILLERGPSGQNLHSGETCGSGLPRLLRQECGLELPTGIFTPLRRFHSAWGSDALDCQDHLLMSAGPGVILDRPRFDVWLREEARREGAEIRSGFTVTGGDWRTDRWLLRGVTSEGDTRELEAAFVVEAGGKRATARLVADAPRFYIDQLVAAVVEIAGMGAGAIDALVESTPAGWWYGAVLPTGRRVVAWFTDADLLRDGTDAAGQISKTRHVRRFAPEVEAGMAFRITSARSSVRRLLWRGTWLAVGDAARTLDPLSGSGIESAVRSGMEAAGAIRVATESASNDELRRFAVAGAEAFHQGMSARQRVYAAERRWSDWPFWRRRNSSPL